MLIDLHTHTHHHSFDSGLNVKDLLRRAKAAGLDGVCLTEHNAIWDEAEARRLAKQWGLAVFRGMEVSTDHGHVLAFGLPRFLPEMLRFARLHAIALDAGGALVLAHPQREPRLPFTIAELPRWFQAVEVLNGSDANQANGYLAGLVADVGIPGAGGSDAHSLGPIGTCATRFQVPVHSEAALVQALRAGQCAAVNLWPGSP